MCIDALNTMELLQHFLHFVYMMTLVQLVAVFISIWAEEYEPCPAKTNYLGKLRFSEVRIHTLYN